MFSTAALISALCVTGFAAESAINNRIVNGTNAPEGKYPFQVSVQYYGSHTCAGTILTAEYVLTAAHCVIWDPAPEVFNVSAGSNYLQGTIHQVTEIMFHEAFNFPYALNDIAVLRVSPAFDFNNELLGPVALPEQYQQTFAETEATVIGWGLNATGGSLQPVLQEVGIFILSDEECYDIYNTYNGNYNPNNVCAGVREGGKGECNGDSGGPLLVNGQQVGIVSWSKKPCTEAPYPGVYTQVSSFIDWIKSKVPV
ncbi:trypsin-1-like isoform X1 [Cloeon dipterum]|uniref:trypsin-1-like isoform X1 n=1 Tax=Cloeon dipterum TaxID=197152 RepID=UPI00321F98F0